MNLKWRCAMLIQKMTFWVSAPLWVLCLPASLSAQTTFATITGTVTDPVNAMVPRVRIIVTNVATNTETTTESNDVGIYVLGTIKEGIYTLRAQHTGFKEFVVQDLVLAARDYRRIDIRLELGEQRDSIEVTSGATLIESDSARVVET